MASFQPGTHFAQHRILRLLGEGETTEVYEVLAPAGGRRALKLVKAHIPLSSKPQARLAQEIEAVAMIHHLNVVRFHGAGLDEGRVWLLLELVQGLHLRALAQRTGGAIPVERAVNLFAQACEGVAAAHALGIVHRDLTPENILVTEDDMAKVADFGSAKLDGWGVRTTSDRKRLASLRYTAPEHMLGNPVGTWSDVYVMALLLYESVAGEHPIAPDSADLAVISSRQIAHHPPPLALLGLPGDLSAIVQRAMAKEPERRPTMVELATELATVLQRLQAPRRALARALPLPNRETGLAMTLPAMTAIGNLAEERAPALLEAPEPSALEHESGRSAVLPPEPSAGVASQSATTRRSRTESERLSRGAWESRTSAAPERASTTAPVESAALPARPRAPLSKGARRALAAAALTGLLGVFLAEWSVIAPGRATPASAAPPWGSAVLEPPPPAAPAVSASAPSASSPPDHPEKPRRLTPP